ncbi:MAG: rhomboid family intramembrane serine protease [Muribaculaceae bacterium]|nr:rhomboid family intramembrane serine protease [Muribaculaceae bacterium]
MTQERNSFFSSIPTITKNLIIINFIVWLAMMILPERTGINFEQYGALHFFTSPDFNPAQIITYMFMHSTFDFSHILFNMFGLFMFGSLLERVLGPKRFLFYYISCGIGAALIQEGVFAIRYIDATAQIPSDVLSRIAIEGAQAIHNGKNFIDPFLANLNSIINVPTVGASGAIFGILLAFGMIFPNMPMYIMFIPIPVKAKWMVLGYGILELSFGLTGINDSVAHFAHLGGMVFGFLLIYYWKRKGIINGTYL